jgi:CRP/FNR family transcriptional regulator, nitrogen oxide reductase regulator
MPPSPITGLRVDVRPRFLEGLRPAEIDVVLAAANRRSFAANSVVTDQGKSADYFFLLTDGRARFFFITEEGRKILLHWLVPGEIFGVFSLLSHPSSYLVSTEVLKDSWLLVWNRATIATLTARYPQPLRNALTTASDYLTLYCAAHTALTCHTAEQRFANVLVSLTRRLGRKVPGGIELEVTNEELAAC